MSKKETKTKRPIESYEHRDKERVNNPPVGLVTPETDQEAGQKKKTYAYDPHLDPQLVWAGKAEHTSFEVPTVSLHLKALLCREALPYFPGTWYDQASVRVGNGINFNRYFYKPKALRTLEKSHADLLAVEKEAEGLLNEILGGHTQWNLNKDNRSSRREMTLCR
jgi:adenine-specific DNA-methyltransferase